MAVAAIAAARKVREAREKKASFRRPSRDVRGDHHLDHIDPLGEDEDPGPGRQLGSLLSLSLQLRQVDKATGFKHNLRSLALCCMKDADGERSASPNASFAGLPFQGPLRAAYSSYLLQVTVAVLIFSNFLVTAAEKQISPEESDTVMRSFLILEYAFNSAFSLELAVNMYANWFWPFWRSSWNVFDAVIVSVSWVSLSSPDLPGIAVLRLFRAARVFRLFKRVASLRTIIEGVLAALPAVSNAFAVLLIIMGIWSIVGVEFFGTSAGDKFGRFDRAMFTMFQAMTGDSWASNMARPLAHGESQNPYAIPFFITYMFVAAIVLTNVWLLRSPRGGSDMVGS